MPSDHDRELAGAQAAIVRALASGGPTPEGFDERAITRARTILSGKKARVARRVAAHESAPGSDGRARPGRLRRLWQALARLMRSGPARC